MAWIAVIIVSAAMAGFIAGFVAAKTSLSPIADWKQAADSWELACHKWEKAAKDWEQVAKELQQYAGGRE